MEDDFVDSTLQAVEGDKQRLLVTFRQLVEKPHCAAQVALPALQEALQPQKQTILINEENQLLENCLRSLLQELVAEAVGAGEPAMKFRLQPDGDGRGPVIRLLDLTLHLCEHGHSEAGIVFQLLEDLTEISTVAECKGVFEYIESKQEILGKAELLGRGKLVLLRACNQLLRRLSKANDVVFCGRILMFLSHFFPISERSAANIKGNFNSSKKTEFEKEAPSEGPPIDFNFYTTFWALQETFSNPPTALQPARWQQFSEGLAMVLEVLEAQPLVGEEEASGGLQGVDSVYNTKYLTSSTLMGLELRDCSFRRNFLMQCLILLDYLKNSAKVEKDEKREAIREEAVQIELRVDKLLRSIPPLAEQFIHAAHHILTREQNWVQWKKDGCPAFEKSAPERPSAARPLAKRVRFLLGNRELDQLFKWAEKNPDALTDESRVRVPPVAEYFAPLAADLDPAAGIEAEYSHKNNKVYCWRGLRLAMQQDVEAFERFGDMGIEGVVPPELLVEEVRRKLHQSRAQVAAKVKLVKKEMKVAGPRAVSQPALAMGQPPVAQLQQAHGETKQVASNSTLPPNGIEAIADQLDGDDSPNEPTSPRVPTPGSAPMEIDADAEPLEPRVNAKAEEESEAEVDDGGVGKAPPAALLMFDLNNLPASSHASPSRVPDAGEGQLPLQSGSADKETVGGQSSPAELVIPPGKEMQTSPEAATDANGTLPEGQESDLIKGTLAAAALRKRPHPDS